MPAYNLCRICLIEDTNIEAMHPLFDKNSRRCTEIVQQIEECGGIVLKAHEEFPKLICFQCLESLNVSHKFWRMCQSSEHALLDAIVKSEMKTEPRENSVTPALRSDSQDELFFDLRTEFIDAREVDLADITEDRDNHFATDNDDDETHDAEAGSSRDYVVDSDGDPSESDSSAEEENKSRIVNKKTRTRAQLKVTKLAQRRKRGRAQQPPRTGSVSPTLSDRISQEDSPKKKPGRGRKKLEVAASSIMCEICGNIYSKQSLLNMHMRRHMAQKPFECEICGKSFACPSEIGRHMRVHTGEKPYVCRFCGRTFADRSTNIKHERIHTNERPFSCKTCGKSFTYSNVLKNHMLTHTGEKPFPCLACNKTFSRKHQLDQHCSTITHQQTVKNLSVQEIDLKDDPVVLIQTHEAFATV